METRLWAALLEGYGQTLTLRTKEGERQLKAFFQPVEEKAPGWEPSPLGPAPAGKYLYLGPADGDLGETAEVVWRGRAFRLLRTRLYCLGETPLYRWAIFEPWEVGT